MTSGSIVVDADGTKLSYTDSGAPSNSGYITIFAVNGLGFNANIFSQVQPVAVANGFRFVGVNRRSYGDSTPLSESQLATMANGTDDAKTELWQKIGVELLTFLDTFSQQNNLPVVSKDRKTGGIVLIGWSFGNTVTLPAIANIINVAADVRTRLGDRLRTLVLQEPPTNGLGMSLPTQTWLPHRNTQFPAEKKGPLFAQWITSYFDHGDLSKRDVSVLEYFVPSFHTTPSVWNKPDKFGPALGADASVIIDAQTAGPMAQQLLYGYEHALFDQAVRDALPNMKAKFFIGTRTAAFLINCLWTVQEKAATYDGNLIEFKVNEGSNHFLFWDQPQEAVDLYRELVA